MIRKAAKELMRTIPVSMPPTLIDRIERSARENGTHRSEEIRNLIQLGFKTKNTNFNKGE